MNFEEFARGFEKATAKCTHKDMELLKIDSALHLGKSLIFKI